MSDKTCGTCGHVTAEIVCRFTDEDGCELCEINDREAKACYEWIERTDSLEQIALDLFAAYDFAARHLPEQYDRVMAMLRKDDFKKRLHAQGVGVSQ